VVKKSKKSHQDDDDDDRDDSSSGSEDEFDRDDRERKEDLEARDAFADRLKKKDKDKTRSVVSKSEKKVKFFLLQWLFLIKHK